jgi:hypothetical protein
MNKIGSRHRRFKNIIGDTVMFNSMNLNNSLIAAAIATVHHGHAVSVRDSKDQKENLRNQHMLVQQLASAAKAKTAQAASKGRMA